MKHLLEVKDLQTSLTSQKKKIYAVRNVSFQLDSGETLGIVGESGCGKSILAKTITRLLPYYTAKVEGGEVFFKNENLLKKNEKSMRQIRGKEISMIFQDPMTSLNPTMKIGKQIEEGYHLHHPKVTQEEAYIRVLELLKQVGIPQYETRYHQYPHELSGGMRQRVMIAIAMIAKPQILIADEPTTALDVTIQAQILELLKAIQIKEQMSIILITHDLSIISNFCDRVLVMYAGEIIESGTVEELFRAPKHPYTKSLLQSIPRLDAPFGKPLHSIQGAPPDLTSLIPGCNFEKRCPFRSEKCHLKKPPRITLEDTHTVNCFLYENKGEMNE